MSHLAALTSLLACACSGDVSPNAANGSWGTPDNGTPSTPAVDGQTPATNVGSNPASTSSTVGSPNASGLGTDSAAPNASTANSNSAATDTASTATDAPLTGETVAPPTELTCVAGAELTEGVSRLRRITRAEYNNIVRDLLGVTGSPADRVEPDESIGPFPSNAVTPATDLIIEQYQTVASELAALVDSASLAGCDVASDGCMTDFITRFGLRLYRRPLQPAEVASYEQLFTLASTQGDAQAGFRAVVETLLQSPHFLYHVEIGAAGVPTTTPSALTPYELAARLSFFLWNSTPDDELLNAAATGELLDPTALASQAQRLLTSDKSRSAISLFHERLLGVQSVLGASKDAALYPAFSPVLAQAMLDETRDFADYVLRQGDGRLSTLLSSNVSLLSEPLFALYGIAKPTGWTPGTPVELDPTQRAGLLTQASFLTTHAHPNQTSPVHRGIAVRENLLCQTLPAPPANVNNVAPAPNATTTTRQRLAQHVADPSCAGCHTLIDPIGLGFENYDPIGAYRSQDGNFPVDAVGEVTAAGDDVAGTFDGAVELAAKLAHSEQVADCVTNQWFRFALGRMESNDDACTIEHLRQDFKASGGDIRQLMVSLVGSHAFTHVRTLGTQDELTTEQ